MSQRSVAAIYHGGPMDMQTAAVSMTDGRPPDTICVAAPNEPVSWLGKPVADGPPKTGRYLLAEVRRKRPGLLWFPDLEVGDILGVTYRWAGWSS